MNSYELTVILNSKSAETAKEKVKQILQKNEVSITRENEWGNKKLAYMIGKEKEGYYLIFNIEANGSACKKVTDAFKIDSNILRHLFVKTKKQKSA